MRSAIVDRPIDPSALLAEVADPANGASVLFLGTVRDMNDGRAVSGIEYRVYRDMATRELESIVREAAERYETRALAVEHRVGHLALGEISVGIAAAHPHRAAAYDASRYVIEEIKQRLPIWKREEYVGGTREWVNAGLGTRDSGTAGTRDSGLETARREAVPVPEAAPASRVPSPESRP